MLIDLEGWVIIWVGKHNTYPSMTSNIANEKLAQEMAQGYLETGRVWEILAICHANDLRKLKKVKKPRHKK